MKIIDYDADAEERMYCPSTREVIVDPDGGLINGEADAVIGFWGSLSPTEPEIKDEKLRTAWDAFLGQFKRDAGAGDADGDDDEIDELDVWEALEGFLGDFKSKRWIVYKTTMSSGPGADEMYIVVKADTILQEIEPDDE